MKLGRIALIFLASALLEIFVAANSGARLDNTGKDFIAFVNHNQDAQAIVEQVNKQYPNGYLARAAKGKR